MCRIRKDITISKVVLEKMDELCTKLDMKRSTYIEMLIRADLEKQKITIEKNNIIELWDGEIEDMPITMIDN